MLLRYFIKFMALILYVSFSFAAARDTQTVNNNININLLSNDDSNIALLENNCKEPFLLEKILFESDVLIEEKELIYLTDLHENTYITVEKLKKALSFLRSKNKFQSATLSFKQGKSGANPAGKILIFNLKGIWTFLKVKFKGSLVGKDRYEQFYLIEPGAPFDFDKHKTSIAKIKEELKNDGYLNSKVEDKIIYSKETKQASVEIHLDTSDRFKINQVSVNIKVKELKELTDEFKNLKQKIAKFLTHDLNNSPYSKTLINEQYQSIKTYLVKEGFLNPKITCKTNIDKNNSKVSLNFDITLFQKKRFVFVGNEFLSTNEIFNSLLVVGSSTFLIPPSLLVDDLILMYKNKGFWQAVVNWQEDSDKFLFTIKEGPRIKVQKVTLKNIKSLDYESILNKSFADFYKSNFFDADILNQSIEKLTAEYVQEGFWDFNVEKQDFILISKEDVTSGGGHNAPPAANLPVDAIEPDKYELVLRIVEGERHMLKSVIIEGYNKLETEGPFALWYKNSEAKPLNMSIVKEQQLWLANYFLKLGYMYTTVQPKFISKKDGIELHWQIKHNIGPTHFGKTVILGSNKISQDIVMRELQYKEGDIWSKEKIEQSLKNLKNLNIFESVSIVPHNLSTPEETKAVLLKLVEDDPFEIRTRLGFQQVSRTFTHLPTATYRIGGSFLWKNPFGIADQFRLDGDLTRFTRNLSATYEVPWICNYPFRTLVRGYSAQFAQPIIAGSNDRLYTESHDGLFINSKRLFAQFQTALTCGFEFMKISGFCDDLAKIIQFEPTLVNKRIPNIIIEPTVSINKFDNPVDPTIGSLTLVSAKGVFPVTLKTGSYVKFLFEQSFVHPIYKTYLTGALRFRFGHIFNTKFSNIMPTERFYLGGASTLRGYEPDMAPPLNSYITCNNECSWVPLGGKTMFNLNAELRFPVWRNFSGAIFNDMGLLVQDKWSDITADKILGATGFGVRVATPIGPVRFDLGFKWKKRHPDDRSYAWFLTLGQAF